MAFERVRKLFGRTDNQPGTDGSATVSGDAGNAKPSASKTIIYHGCEITLTQDSRRGPVNITRNTEGTEAVDIFWTLFRPLRDRKDLGLPEGELVPYIANRSNNVTGNPNVIWAHGTNMATVIRAISTLASEPLPEIEPKTQATSRATPRTPHTSPTSQPTSFDNLRRYLTDRKVLGDTRGAIINRIRAAGEDEDLGTVVDGMSDLDSETRRNARAALKDGGWIR
jgi:hypothetical protein